MNFADIAKSFSKSFRPEHAGDALYHTIIAVNVAGLGFMGYKWLGSHMSRAKPPSASVQR